MSGNLTEGPQRGPQDAPLSFKRLFKKSVAPSGDMELQQCKALPSALPAQQEQVVCVRQARKCYGTHNNPLVVLDGFNMTVFKGTIYALLGASGCGKTTLLSCILDQRTLDSGNIWILGGTPGSKASGVPGPRVGYMPQTNAIYEDFTLHETFKFYGWVLGLTNNQIQKRFEFLKQLLMLPDTDVLVKYFSGGQQRRVSLAVTLLHEPELLVLDEPTVGLDPVLRETIWEHLVDLVKRGNTTIILTTHYIEEARQAHIVGLMREGCLLAEEPPERLIFRYRARTLEDVFLKLSVRQDKRLPSTSIEGRGHDVVIPVNSSSASVQKISDDLQTPSTSHADVEEIHPNLEEERIISLPGMLPQNKHNSKSSGCLPFIKIRHMKALVWKGFLWMTRHIPVLFFILALPIAQVSVICTAVGKDPRYFPVAVVNHETNNSLSCNTTLACNSVHLSCSYLEYLKKRDVNLVYYDSEDLARETVLRAINAASIVVKHNYSAALRVRIADWETTKPWDMTASQIDVFRDLSNKHVTIQLQMYLYDSFQTFIQDFVESCGMNRMMVQTPVKFEEPIYAVMQPSYTDFALPSSIMIIAFFLGMEGTTFSMLTERTQGNLERTFLVGITEIELLIAHILCQSVLMAAQVIATLIFAFGVFEMTINGSLLLVTIHMLLTGFCGMCKGLLLSCLCDKETTAMYLAAGTFIPLIFLCGVTWPIEAMHPLLQPVVYFLPLTQSVESLRSILQRGWGLDSLTVCLGFVSLIVWIIIFLVLSLILLLKFKNKEFIQNPLLLVINMCQKWIMSLKIK